jgi:uncharacterized membrane protein (DUF4010 family)
MDPALVFQKVAMALGLGLLVGLQRQSVQSRIAGIRTFALITVLGAVAGLIGLDLGGWFVGAGALGVAAFLVVGNLLKARDNDIDPGLTTEVAALLMYGVGAYLVVGHATVALAVGGGVALLLHLKEPMHEFVGRIGPADLKAIMQFVLISLVIWPVLPNETYGPYEVLNPHEIWLMVVLIVGIGLGGYVAYKLFGERAGTILGGVLGGLISSTATTVSYARRTQVDNGEKRGPSDRPNEDHSRSSPAVPSPSPTSSVPAAALVIVLASTIAFARVLTEIAVVAPKVFWAMAPPLAIMLVGMASLCVAVYFMSRSEKLQMSEQKNPAELRAALMFGALYTVVILAVAAAQDLLGTGALYPVAILSGLYDMDAITLSTARLADQNQLDVDTGWRLVLTASLSNLVIKGVIVGIMGKRLLLAWIAVLFGIALAGGIVLLLIWPSNL